tara:strand:- start:211 stop:531 length:321 start_codon:yes stop_codon:yes gene_type:complete
MVSKQYVKVSNMTWEDIIKQTDEYEMPSEEEQLKERVDEFYEDMKDEIGRHLDELTSDIYEFEYEMKMDNVFPSVRNEPKMKKFFNKFFEGVNLLREAQRIAEGED